MASASFPCLTMLSCLALRPPAPDSAPGISQISGGAFADLTALAASHHVLVRGLESALCTYRKLSDHERAEWALAALENERRRIVNALAFLSEICAAFAGQGYTLTVIKSLDHWPDLGSDLDLYTDESPKKILSLMKQRFHAQLAPRSWGDRLAGKWNFVLPGLPELVEIHFRRLGQTGEQDRLAARLVARSRPVHIAGYTFSVPAPADRLLISTLQRMYRHFNFRLCDILDTAVLAQDPGIDFEDLRAAAEAAGILEGVATYLVIVSDYLMQYRNEGLDLPTFVTATARFGGDHIYFARGFLRVPIVPQSARLYKTQLAGLLRQRELRRSARLGLLPWLGAAAAVGQKVTGSDKGVW